MHADPPSGWAPPPPPQSQAPGTLYPPHPPAYLPPPYLYQQPYPGPKPPPPSVVGDGGTVIAGLGYLFFLLGLIMFFAEQRNRFVKFHAAQSLLIHLAAVLATFVWLALFIVFAVVGVSLGVASSSSGGVAASFVGIFFLIAVLLGIVAAMLYVAALIWGMVAAFGGKATKLPVVGSLAERWAGGPLPRP